MNPSDFTGPLFADWRQGSEKEAAEKWESGKRRSQEAAVGEFSIQESGEEESGASNRSGIQEFSIQEIPATSPSSGGTLALQEVAGGQDGHAVEGAAK